MFDSEAKNDINIRITPYPMGSIRELVAIALPLMLNNLSNNLMLFFDRLILSNYSLDAMNAAITIGIICSIVLFSISAITATSEIFIGRYNGAQNYAKIGQPVWQMIWFSLMTLIIFIPLGLYGGKLLIPVQYKNMGSHFYQWYMISGPVFAFVSTLTAFYAGIGKIKIITFTVIFANIINLILAIVFVFGIKGFIPEFGLEGAAIAGVVSQIAQATVLFYVFLHKKNRIKYYTNNLRFNLQQLIEILRLGIPVAIGYIIELGAWAFILYELTQAGSMYITVFTVGQSLFVIFAIISEGIQKSIAIITSNFIGANKWNYISVMLRSAIKFQLFISLLILMPLASCSDNIVNLFSGKLSVGNLNHLKQLAGYSLIWFWIFFTFDGIKWIIASVLVALKKTASVMLINFISIWIFAVMPIYLYITKYQNSPLVIWLSLILYSFMNTIFLLTHYWLKSMSWRK